MGGCQNYGPFLGTLNIRGRTIIGTIILTTTHIYLYIYMYTHTCVYIYICIHICMYRVIGLRRAPARAEKGDIGLYRTMAGCRV